MFGCGKYGHIHIDLRRRAGFVIADWPYKVPVSAYGSRMIDSFSARCVCSLPSNAAGCWLTFIEHIGGYVGKLEAGDQFAAFGVIKNQLAG